MKVWTGSSALSLRAAWRRWTLRSLHSFHSHTVASQQRAEPSPPVSLRLERWLLRRCWGAPARRSARASRRSARSWSGTERRWICPRWLSRKWRGIYGTRLQVRARLMVVLVLVVVAVGRRSAGKLRHLKPKKGANTTTTTTITTTTIVVTVAMKMTKTGVCAPVCVSMAQQDSITPRV